MLGLVDRLAVAWLNRRRRAAVKHDPALAQFAISKIEMDANMLKITANAPMIAVFAEEAWALLEANDAKNYVQFDVLPRWTPGSKAVRCTVQWANGESPAEQNNRLRAELAACKDLAFDVLP